MARVHDLRSSRVTLTESPSCECLMTRRNSNSGSQDGRDTTFAATRERRPDVPECSRVPAVCYIILHHHSIPSRLPTMTVHFRSWEIFRPSRYFERCLLEGNRR
jgi:hypothetical protein